MDADRVVVGISGGVDSAVAAALLARAGREVHALFMRNWDDDDGYCTAAADLQDARRVCEDLGIPLHVVNFAAEYRARVFGHFLDELAAGRTPNPDVALQSRDQVRSLSRARTPAGRRAFRHGTLRASRLRAGRPAAQARGGPFQGPELFPAHGVCRGLRPLRVSGRRPVQDRSAPPGARVRAPGARQARQHRDLLHRRAPFRRVPFAVPAGDARSDRDA